MDEFISYIELGITHVLDIHAIDHILFISLLAIPFTFKSWKKILWWITAFTIGHFLPLLLVSLLSIRFDAGLVELLIPVTIMLTAIYNLYTAKTGGKTGWMQVILAAGFGIIHGFGFANAIGMVADASDAPVLVFTFFSIGVFVAQVITAVAVLLLGIVLRALIRLNMPEWVIMASSIVIGLSLPLLLGQMSAYW